MQKVVEKEEKKKDSRAHLCLKCGRVIEVSKLNEEEYYSSCCYEETNYLV